MTTPAFNITGDKDIKPVFSEREDWRADAYRLSPRPKPLLTMRGAEHIFGGISGYDAREASDEDRACDVVAAELADPANSVGAVESKSPERTNPGQHNPCGVGTVGLEPGRRWAALKAGKLWNSVED